jgi:hypothetical protein
MQWNILAIATLVCGLALPSGCHTPATPKSATQTAYTAGQWPLQGVQTQPAAIEVESATRFTCSGIRCQLLGVRESSDPAVRAKATQFAKRWFDSVGDDIVFYNESNPLVARDGTCIVWVCGIASYVSCLNEELVQAGLVEIETAPWQWYSFNEPARSGEHIPKWQRDLAEAKATGKRGGKRRVLFDWP